MTPYRTFRRLDIKQIAIDKLSTLLIQKTRLFTTKTIWINTPIKDIITVENTQGYVKFTKSNGSYAYPRSLNGSDLIKIIDQLKNNEIYSFIEGENGVQLKIKPRISD